MRLRPSGAARKPRGRTPAGPTLRIDHLVVCARTLEEGSAAVEAALGVSLDPGGRHDAMGTHNRLLSLGPEEYLEVIAIDPAGRDPGRPRWFGLDAWDGPPALGAWVARTDDLDAVLAQAPEGMSAPMDLARGDLRWRMATPDPDAVDGAYPALIEWRSDPAAPRLPDRGCRLRRLEVAAPGAWAVRDLLAPLMHEERRVLFGEGPRAMAAVIDTPAGRRSLGPPPA